MMKSLLFAMALSLPLMAQQAAPEPQDTPPPPPPQGRAASPHGNPHHAAFLEEFDINKDGRIDEQEKEAIRAVFAERKAEYQRKILEKYDANKDGQLDEQEKAAARADFEKNGPRRSRPHHRGHGPAVPPQGCRPPMSGCCCCCGENGRAPRPHAPQPPCDKVPATPVAPAAPAE